MQNQLLQFARYRPIPPDHNPLSMSHHPHPLLILINGRPLTPRTPANQLSNPKYLPKWLPPHNIPSLRAELILNLLPNPMFLTLPRITHICSTR